jgi:hypothetical protein
MLLSCSNCTQSTVITAELVLLGTHAVSLALAGGVQMLVEAGEINPHHRNDARVGGRGNSFLVVQFPVSPATEYTCGNGQCLADIPSWW